MEKPQLYHDNNAGGSIALLKAMQACGVKHLVFSSSATVYGEPRRLPYTELVIERLLADQAMRDPDFHYAALRYFNQVGAHPPGRIGEDPRGVPNNLFRYIAQVATGARLALRAWGTTIRRATARACATTSTSWTSPARIWPLSHRCRSAAARYWPASAPVAAIPS